MGVLPTEVGPEQAMVMEQEVKDLLEKGAIERVPHSDRENGFYSQYFIVPKKDVWLRPILDLWVLYSAVEVQNVNSETNRATNQVQGLVCHDRPQRRILLYFHPSISQEVSKSLILGEKHTNTEFFRLV